MNDNDNEKNMQNQTTNTYCYSYEVVMHVQVLGNTEEYAYTLLNGNGGYISKREITLVKTVLIDDENKE
jgi:hypothetical protein